MKYKIKSRMFHIPHSVVDDAERTAIEEKETIDLLGIPLDTIKIDHIYRWCIEQRGNIYDYECKYVKNASSIEVLQKRNKNRINNQLKFYENASLYLSNTYFDYSGKSTKLNRTLMHLLKPEEFRNYIPNIFCYFGKNITGNYWMTIQEVYPMISKRWIKKEFYK